MWLYHQYVLVWRHWLCGCTISLCSYGDTDCVAVPSVCVLWRHWPCGCTISLLVWWHWLCGCTISLLSCGDTVCVAVLSVCIRVATLTVWLYYQSVLVWLYHQSVLVWRHWLCGCTVSLCSCGDTDCVAVLSVCTRVATLTMWLYYQSDLVWRHCVCVQSGLFIRRASSYHNPGNNPERVWVFMRFGMSGAECGKAELETEIRSIKLASNSTGCRCYTYQVSASFYMPWVATFAACEVWSAWPSSCLSNIAGGFTSVCLFPNNKHEMDVSYCNRVNRALLGWRFYSCQVGTHGTTILPSATSCKRAQTSSVFSEVSWPESAAPWSGWVCDCENRETCTGAALQPCSSECEWVSLCEQERAVR